MAARPSKLPPEGDKVPPEGDKLPPEGVLGVVWVLAPHNSLRGELYGGSPLITSGGSFGFRSLWREINSLQREFCGVFLPTNFLRREMHGGSPLTTPSGGR
jgi:hypothetical protein